jgi:hypothetical protein
LDAIVDPPFISKPKWLKRTVKLILKHFNAKDEGAERVPPMALVRCSRGGKTRSLRELACLLKTKLPDVAVIFISLNDFSTLETWENNDQIGALCRRIAYMSLKDRALLSRIQVRECPEGHHPVVVGDIEVCAFDRRAEPILTWQCSCSLSQG